MKRLSVVTIAALTCIAAPMLVSAQTRPDFSGHWRFDAQKSGKGTEGNSPDVTYPTDLQLKQTAAELHFQGRSLRQDDVVAVYKFDGSEVAVTVGEGITERAKARWDGQILVVTSRRSFPLPGGGGAESVSTFEDRWTLKGDILTIQRTADIDGHSVTRSFAFDRITS